MKHNRKKEKKRSIRDESFCSEEYPESEKRDGEKKEHQSRSGKPPRIMFPNKKHENKQKNYILAISEATKKDIIQILAIPENKIRVICPGI